VAVYFSAGMHTGKVNTNKNRQFQWTAIAPITRAWGHFNSADVCRLNGDLKLVDIFERIKKFEIQLRSITWFALRIITQNRMIIVAKWLY